jgi:hypothetical protein
MGSLWNFENLEDLTRHKKPLVRMWAFERLSFLYPEMTGATAIRLITDKDVSISRAAIEYFVSHPDKRYVEGLLEAYRKSSGNTAALIANAIVNAKDARIIHSFREKYSSNDQHDLMGYALSVFHIAGLHTSDSKMIAEDSLKNLKASCDNIKTVSRSIFIANLAAGTDISRLLDLAFSHPDSPAILTSLLAAICQYCGSWYNEDDLFEEAKKGVIQRKLPPLVMDSFKDLEEKGFKDTARVLEKLFRKGKYDRIIRELHDCMNILLDKKRGEYGEESFNLWQKGSGVPRQNISAITAFFKIIEETPKESIELIAKTALVVLQLLVDCAQLIGENIERMGTEELLEIFLQERDNVEEDMRIMEILFSAPEREKIVHSCLSYIEIDPFSLAGPRIVLLLSDIMDEHIASGLIRIDTKHYELWDRFLEGIAGLGASAITLVKPFFEESTPGKVDYALRILRYIPTNDSVETILKYWKSLWENNKETLLETIRGIGDRRFIAPLKGELKEGELYESEVFYLLCLINRVVDPDLKNIKKALEKGKKETDERMEKFLEGDMEGLLQGPLEVELKCRRCRKEYHYHIEKVMMDDETGSNHIMDDIKCKNCGAVNHYEITPKGQLSIMSYMMLMVAIAKKENKASDNSPISIAKFMPIDGKKMSLKEAIPYYEKKLDKDPKNITYILGYANTLRNIKRTEDAIPFYQTAIQHDPMAVEAYVSLAQIADIRGDLNKAYHYYARAAEIINTGNYYKVAMDRDDFKEAVLDHFMGISKRLGKKLQPLPKKGTKTVVKRQKVGRNAPCPCGSGKKYKKCCLRQGEGKIPKRPSPDNTEKQLMEKVLKYSKNIPRRELLDASALYWGIEPEEPLLLPEEAQNEGVAFIEWFVHDYLLSSGKTILEEYYSSHLKRLTRNEIDILKSHMKACPGVYEVQEVAKGVGMKLKDIFTSKELDVKDVKGSYQVVKWDFLLVRVYNLKGVKRLVGIGSILPRHTVQGLKEFLLHEFEKFKVETGRHDWKDFMKKRSYLIEHYMKNLPEERPAFVTPEGHSLIISKAHFNIRGFDRVLDILYEEKDFELDDLHPHKNAKFSWLKKGESREWEVVKPEKGIILDSRFMHESGKLSWDILGNIMIDRQSLTLECISKERLKKGTQRLNDLLKGHIDHKVDTFEDMEVAIERNRGERHHDEEEEPDSYAQYMMESMMHQKFREWVDERIPALDGMTPREAIRSEDGRDKIVEIIKGMENSEERKKMKGMSCMDISFIREELGLKSEVSLSK